MSAHCDRCGTDITYPAGTWPLGECYPCRLERERDAAVAERDKLAEGVKGWQRIAQAHKAAARQLREALELAVQSIEDAYGGYAFVPENTLEHDAVVQGHAALRGHDPALTAGAKATTGVRDTGRPMSDARSSGGQVPDAFTPAVSAEPEPHQVRTIDPLAALRGQRQPEEPGR